MIEKIHSFRGYEIFAVDRLTHVIEEFNKDKPKILGFDTETTGLHIMKDRPFLVQFGWKGKVFVFEPTLTNLSGMQYIMKQAKYVFAHNTKYDLHMLANVGFNPNGINWADNMSLARLLLDIVPDQKDPLYVSLALKDLGVKLLDKNINASQKLIKEELNRLKKERLNPLVTALKQFPTGGQTATGKIQYWGKGLIEDFLKDPTHDIEDLPDDVREVWVKWQEEYPETTYADINRDLMNKYASEDVVIMLDVIYYLLGTKKYQERFAQQRKVFENECHSILPFYRMERVGLCMDQSYLEESRLRVKAYIRQKRERLYQLLGAKINVGQHESLKKAFKEKWDIDVPSMDKPNLKRIIEATEGDPKEAAQVIKTLRTLEKWYKTYIIRIINSSSYDGRSYTQINLAGAVSGRVASDFQQFPKDPIKDDEGNILFYPRQAIILSEGYDHIYYLDFSQIELREQANYTLLVSGGDRNLCRSYFPFLCKSTATGETYDWKNRDHIKRWNSGEWVDEEGKPWAKTDVHALTTHNTLMALGYECYEENHSYEYKGSGEPFFGAIIDDEVFHRIRYKGKTFNFMANYGGGKGAAMDSLDLPEDIADALVKGYATSFPKVSAYQQSVASVYGHRMYVKNHYGRHYFLHPKYKRQAYRLANYLIQGTCADQLKYCIVLIDELLKPYKSRMVIPIHDEIQFEMTEDELFLIPQILDIMQHMDERHFVPIVSDVERTESNWAEKYEYEDWKVS